MKNLTLVLVLGIGLQLFAKNFTVDSSQSTIAFLAKKFAVVEVKGSFKSFGGTLVVDNNKLSKIDGFVNTASVNTDNEERDSFISSSKLFFNSKEFTKLIFKANKISDTVVNADIQIKHFKKAIDFKIEELNIQDKQLKLTLSGEVNRQDFKLNTHKDSIVADMVLVKATIVAQAD